MKGFLIDLDGVIYDADRAMPGAADTISFLNRHRIPYLFLTNTSSAPVSVVWQKLKFLGVETPIEKILTPVIAARHWIRQHNCEPAAVFMPRPTVADLKDINILPAELESGARCIIIGDLGDQWDYHKLNRAFRLLENAGDDACLIALGMTRYCKTEDGRLRLDVAPFVKALEHSSRVTPTVMGKPAADFFQQAANKLEMPFHELVMIGDDIYSDVHGAQRCGMQGLLVKTGKFRDSDLESEVKPDAVLRSIADLPDWIKQQHWAEDTNSKPAVSKMLEASF